MIDKIIVGILEAYFICMIVYALLSWFPIEPGSAVARIQSSLSLIIEPVLRPVRQLIPPVGGLDLAFLVVAIVLSVVIAALGGSRFI